VGLEGNDLADRMSIHGIETKEPSFIYQTEVGPMSISWGAKKRLNPRLTESIINGHHYLRKET
jgi:hypothetical protein